MLPASEAANWSNRGLRDSTCAETVCSWVQPLPRSTNYSAPEKVKGERSGFRAQGDVRHRKRQDRTLSSVHHSDLGACAAGSLALCHLPAPWRTFPRPATLGPRSLNLLWSELGRDRSDLSRRERCHFPDDNVLDKTARARVHRQVPVNCRADCIWSLNIHDQKRIRPFQHGIGSGQIEAVVMMKIGVDVERLWVRRAPVVKLAHEEARPSAFARRFCLRRSNVRECCTSKGKTRDHGRSDTYFYQVLHVDTRV